MLPRQENPKKTDVNLITPYEKKKHFGSDNLTVKKSADDKNGLELPDFHPASEKS